VAVKPGVVTPNNIFIVGAHYDSVGTPGADDDASSVAGVLEAARVLSQYQFQSTLVFVAFDGEETGLNGSWQYANAAKARGDNIVGMLQVEMIAAPRGNDTKSEVFGWSSQDVIRQQVASAEQTYGGITARISENASAESDHIPFLNNGYSACVTSEYDPFSNYIFHTANDNVDYAGYIDYEYATRMVKGSVGWLAESAVPVPEPATSILCLLLGASFVGLRMWGRRKSAGGLGGGGRQP
jgi:Zn-dependent M28 family amino/carboxypeptidase